MKLKLFFQLVKCLFKRWQDFQYDLIVTNESDAPQQAILFGAYMNLTAVNFGSERYIIIKPLLNVSYMRILSESQSRPFILTELSAQTENKLQSIIPFSIVQIDANGRKEPIDSLSPVRLTNSIYGNTHIEFEVLPKTTLIIKIKGKHIPSPLSMI